MRFEYVRWRVAQVFALAVGLRIAWRRTWRLGIGDRATTVGRMLRLTNGVCAPLWDCQDLATREYLRVEERDMRKVPSLSNYLGSFRDGWRWWFTSWFHIEVGRQLGLNYAYYGTEGAKRRRQRRRDRQYVRDAERHMRERAR